MIDKKYVLSNAQIDALLSEGKIEYYNAWARYWRYDIGINVMPGKWCIVNREKKFIPIMPWKEFQSKPIPEEVFQEWIDKGSFVSGIAGIFGPVWHRPDRKGYYFGQIDADNALAIKEIIAWKGDIDIAALAKRTVVEQHADNSDRSMHVDVYSRTPLTNKDADVPKGDNDRPSFEVHCLGRMGIMAGSRHKRGHPMMLLYHGAGGATTEPLTLEDNNLELYLNNLCIKYGLRPYLANGNGNYNSCNDSVSKKDQEAYYEHNDGIPLAEVIVQMIRKGPEYYDEKINIKNGTRHSTMLKVADYILFTYSEEHDLRSLKDWFILINEYCCTPDPLPIPERDQIWDDAVEYVSRKKAEESNKILSVSEAIRERAGPNKIVRGTIVSVSTPFKVFTKMAVRCLNCNTLSDCRLPSPVVYPHLQVKKPEKCSNCEDTELETANESTEMDDAKIITLQNTDLTNDLDETLEIMLFGDNTKYTKAGEIVTINGTLYHGISNMGVPSKARKTVTLMRAKFVTYEDRRTFVITDRDVESFHKFADYRNKKNGKLDVIERLVSMTAPNVVGWEEIKLGGLRSIVGGVDHRRRGRIGSLFVGDKGLAKTLIMRELVKMVPNSRFITASSASSRSALGIVDVVNETKTLIYGPIPLSSGALVGIDEVQSWTFEEQSVLLSVMEEGIFFLLKYGKNTPIEALTTILATANPQDITYGKGRRSIARNEITLLPPLYDRFDQVYVFLDTRDINEKRRYADKRLQFTEERRPHNYNFIIKYLLYVKRIEPVLSPEAKATLKEFWVILSESNMVGNRSLDSIFRIAQAMAKLQLKTVVDMDVAKQTMESIRSMEEKHGEYIKILDDPREVAISAAEEIVENTKCPILFDAIVEQVRKENEHVNSWLLGGMSHRLSANSNRRYRELRDRFIHRINRPGSRIFVVSMTPLVVTWSTTNASNQSASDISDTSDIKKDSTEKNVVDNECRYAHMLEKSPNDTSGHIQPSQVHPNYDTDFFDRKEKKMSQMSQMSLLLSTSEERKGKPHYEYLKEVDAYRCLWCRCTYYADTKDTCIAHPCNRKEIGGGGPNNYGHQMGQC
jgi:DNA replicative helicase MCM subunit Mcm2 (Cdc46/Mcm family)